MTGNTKNISAQDVDRKLYTKSNLNIDFWSLAQKYKAKNKVLRLSRPPKCRYQEFV